MELNELEKMVVSTLLDAPGIVAEILRRQAASTTVASREWTGAGFTTDLHVSPEIEELQQLRDFEIGDLLGQHPASPHGIGFVLFIRSGRLAWLEGVDFDGLWPGDEASVRLVPQPRTNDRRYLDPQSWGTENGTGPNNLPTR